MKRPAVVTLLMIFAVSLALIGLCNTQGLAQQTPAKKPIGNYVVAKGTVTVTHRGENAPISVNAKDAVLFKDVIQTGPESRTKALFIDDSILTLGENSAMEIAEHVFNPEAQERSTVINLLAGRMRVLVGKLFQGLGSKFEIHTHTAVVAARGTYFVVWLESAIGRAVPVAYVAQGPVTGTGVAVLNGTAQISNAQGSVTVPAGTFSIAFPGATPASPTGFSNNSTVTNQINGTATQDSPTPETPSESLASTGQTQTIEPVDPTAAPTVTPTTGPGGGTGEDTGGTTGGDTGGTTGGGGGGGTSGGTTVKTVTVTIPTVVVPPTIPPIIQTPVAIQMDPEMIRATVAPTKTTNFNLTFPQ